MSKPLNFVPKYPNNGLHTKMYHNFRAKLYHDE